MTSRRFQTLPGIGPVLALRQSLPKRVIFAVSIIIGSSLNTAAWISAKIPVGSKSRRERTIQTRKQALRMLFWMAALVAIHQRENAFRDKYERYLSAIHSMPTGSAKR